MVPKVVTTLAMNTMVATGVAWLIEGAGSDPPVQLNSATPDASVLTAVDVQLTGMLVAVTIKITVLPPTIVFACVSVALRVMVAPVATGLVPTSSSLRAAGPTQAPLKVHPAAVQVATGVGKGV